MSSWVRLWHDMPTDPKWRVVARRSGQRVGDVIAVFNFLMVAASANADERGRTDAFESEDVAAALDLETSDVEAIIVAMKGKVLDDDGRLTGWSKRQPQREDGAAERAAAWREKRKRTQANADERPDTDAESDTDKNAHTFLGASDESFEKALKAYPASGKAATNVPAAREAWSRAVATGGEDRLFVAVSSYSSAPVEKGRTGGAPGFHKWLAEERWRAFLQDDTSTVSDAALEARRALLENMTDA